MTSHSNPAEMPAMPPPAGLLPNLKNPENSLRSIWIIALSVSLFFPTLLVPLRLYVKVFIVKSLHLVDVFCVLGYVGFVTIVSMSLWTLDDGVGLHGWDITAQHFAHYLKVANEQEIVYMPAILFTKIAILLQLLQIFVVGKRNARWYFLHTLIWLNGIFFTTLMFLQIFQCVPRVKIWMPMHAGTCINISKTFVATAAINVVSDLSILVSPIFWILKLQMPLQRKLGIIAIFGTGLFVAEVSSGLIVACLVVVPRLFGNRKATRFAHVAKGSGPSLITPSRKRYVEMNDFSSHLPETQSSLDVEAQIHDGERERYDKWEDPKVKAEAPMANIRKTVSISQSSA